MKAVLQIALLLIRADPRAMLRGAVLGVVVLVMGVALLGLSGWFITATGLAGMAGIGIAFDVFRPSAGVRFLALGRAAARYGERLVTHDATLRALVALRVILLGGYARLNAKGLVGLRSEGALTRIVSDVDALDGVILRLLLPIATAVVTHILVFFVMAWLVGWLIAFAVFAGYIPAAAAILAHLGRQSIEPSARAEAAGQTLRRGLIDMIRDREALILSAQLSRQEKQLCETEAQVRVAAAQVDRAERHADFLLSLLVALVAMGAFLLGGAALAQGYLGPAQAVIGLFIALALAEALLPLRRGVSDLGRMITAAARVVPHLSGPSNVGPTASDGTGPALRIQRPALNLTANAGDAVVLTGPSGAGKSTLLMQIAGLGDDQGITINGVSPNEWREFALREKLAVLPQRSGLIAGTVRDNLSLSGDYEADAMWAALETVTLANDLRPRGGLELRLGEAGAGLSGGQSRRLALARILLKNPEILLLDEPSEGLDKATADAVLSNLRAALPNTLIVAAMHRGANHPTFNQSVRLVL